MPTVRTLPAAFDPAARILDAFARRAREVGVRGVVMADLARDLGMSKKTLYRCFSSKDALVLALVEAWGQTLEEDLRAARARATSPLAYFRDTAEVWIGAFSHFSPAFWAEVRAEHPAASAAIASFLATTRRRMRERLGRHLRAGVERELAIEMLNATITRAADPAVAERLGLTTRETLMAAVDVWARGALRLSSDENRRRTSSARKGARMHPVRTLASLLFLVLLTAFAGSAPAQDKGDRYGIEGKVVAYDPAANTFKIKVTNAGVSGGFGTGGTAGGAPPSDVTAGSEIVMSVVPEGSVLKRTVIKAQTGGGLDTTGTQEGFAKAVKAIPDDRSVVISFEKNAGGNPAYVVRMVQIRLTPEEIQQRIDANTVEE